MGEALPGAGRITVMITLAKRAAVNANVPAPFRVAVTAA